MEISIVIPVYNTGSLLNRTLESSGVGMDGESDEYLMEAIELAASLDNLSVSMLQRRFRIPDRQSVSNTTLQIDCFSNNHRPFELIVNLRRICFSRRLGWIHK